MRHFYVFNGDADGLCALQQLRLAETAPATLITGVKRDIKLLDRVTAASGDAITVLDVSLDTNRDSLMCLLGAGAAVRYFDHHYAGEIPNSPLLQCHIDTAADVCTSILVDRHLGGRHRRWAITAAFGDGLAAVGQTMAQEAGLTADTSAMLEKLGICLNYNAYGETISDLYFDPALLAEEIRPFADPLDFVAGAAIFARLHRGYEDDMEQARSLRPATDVPGALLVIMPSAAWARRAIGVLANELMLARPQSSIAIVSPKVSGNYTVSVRVHAGSPIGADEFCMKFETGGGRRRAGGINALPPSDLDRFAASFEAHFVASR